MAILGCSWYVAIDRTEKHPDSGYGLETPEGFRRHLEIRSRLMKRLDGTAQSIPGFEMEKNWWVWSASCQKFRHKQRMRQGEVQKAAGMRMRTLKPNPKTE